MLIISGCTKAECYSSSDCISKTCSSAKCEAKKCVYTAQTKCCGNGIQEDSESGLPGSQCTCPKDYGKCEGKGKIKVGSRTDDAVYLHYLCSGYKCVMGVSGSDIAPQNFLDSFDSAYFKATAVSKYNKPFDINSDVFEIKITLDDANNDLVLPIRITNVKLLLSNSNSRSELLVASKDLNAEIGEVGDSASIKVPMNLDYKPDEIEESDSVRYSIDYNYIKRIPNGFSSNGTALYKLELARDKFSSPSKQLFLVKTG